jgi:very-short-patch-repair endonuclease
MTLTEVRLWSHLRRRQLDGWKFRRQAPIGEYIVDFYCPAARLVVELDGDSHDSEVAYNYGQSRQAWLESQGLKVLRFSPNYEKQDHLEGVWDAIAFELAQLPTHGAPSGAARHLPAERGG